MRKEGMNLACQIIVGSRRGWTPLLENYLGKKGFLLVESIEIIFTF